MNEVERLHFFKKIIFRFPTMDPKTTVCVFGSTMEILKDRLLLVKVKGGANVSKIRARRY